MSTMVRSVARHDENIRRIDLIRCGIIVIDRDAPQTPEILSGVLAELGALGVVVQNPGDVTDEILSSFEGLRDVLLALRGGQAGVTYAPLFDGFPEKLPEFDLPALRFYLGATRLYGRALLGLDTEELAVAVREVMDFSDLGWWPASSVAQDVDVARVQALRQRFLPGDVVRDGGYAVRVVSRDEAVACREQFVLHCAHATASLPAEVRDDFAALVAAGYGASLSPLDVVFLETRALFLATLFTAAISGGSDEVFDGRVAPDDILRIVAVLSGGDVSLATPFRWKRLSRRERGAVLRLLEATQRRRDVWRRRGLWLSLGKSLHVGEYATKYPRAVELFAELRAQRRDALSLASRSERLLAAGDVGGACDLVASEGPGLFVRGLRRYGSLAEAAGVDVFDFCRFVDLVGSRVPLRALFLARAQLLDNGSTYPRLVMTKAGKPLAVSGPVGHLALRAEWCGAVVDALDAAITTQCRLRDSWQGETVWIDDAVRGLLVPDQLRSVSDSVLNVERGSRLSLPALNVLRMFIHWQEPAGTRSDLDLSCLLFDEDFSLREQVSWTRLFGGGVVHSGDLTSAPGPTGASEFIDVDFSRIAERSAVRYVAPAVYRYSGPGFSELTSAKAGWMARENATSGAKTFDAARVVDAVSLTGGGGYIVPFVYDVAAREIVVVDVHVAGLQHARVESTARDVGSLCKMALLRGSTRAKVIDVVVAHARARGATLVPDRGAASMTVGLDDTCTLNAARPEQLLSTLL